MRAWAGGRRLAWPCGSAFCKHRSMGGSDGATMRFEPGLPWGADAGLRKAQELFEPRRGLEEGPGATYSSR